MKLTRNQNKVLEELQSGKTIYVFPKWLGGCSYGYNKNVTTNKASLVKVCGWLVSKGLCKHWLVNDELVLVIK